MTEDEITRATERFLRWKLPADFHPDAGISFQPTWQTIAGQHYAHSPTGTNLLNFTQAREMVRFILGGGDGKGT